MWVHWLLKPKSPGCSNAKYSNSWVLRLTLGLMMRQSSRVSRTILQGTSVGTMDDFVVSNWATS
jgi:hypothetical protein